MINNFEICLIIIWNFLIAINIFFHIGLYQVLINLILKNFIKILIITCILEMSTWCFNCLKIYGFTSNKIDIYSIRGIFFTNGLWLMRICWRIHVMYTQKCMWKIRCVHCINLLHLCFEGFDILKMNEGHQYYTKLQLIQIEYQE